MTPHSTHDHIDSVRTYVLVLLALLALTVVTTLVSFVDLGDFSVVAALAIAVCKMLLVALFFMHVRYSTRLTRLVILGGLMWLAILLMLTLSDFFTRDWVPGRQRPTQASAQMSLCCAAAGARPALTSPCDNPAITRRG